ncbi:MAG: PKD domain-containing protein [Dehalococcoidia bacterium]|nr:PKD domain-containing protein [Dehalococcoidia bacterium]
MKFPITRTTVLLVAGVAAALMFGSCAAPVQVVNTPPTPAQPSIAQPVIMDIAGAQEWHPNEEGPLICACSDPDGNPLTYYWTAEKGIIKGEGQRVSWAPPEELGEYEITLKVTNDKGGEAVYSKKFTVVAPPPPPVDTTVYLKLTPPATNSATEFRQVKGLSTPEIQCVVAGDPSEYTFTWAANAGKLMADGLEEGKASRVGWIAPNQAGKYTVSVMVFDNAGNKAVGEVNLEVLCCGRGPN